MSHMLLKSHGRQMCIYNSIRIEKVQIEQFFRQKIRYTTTVEAGVGVGGALYIFYISIYFPDMYVTVAEGKHALTAQTV